jgi:hypothetical protein
MVHENEFRFHNDLPVQVLKLTIRFDGDGPENLVRYHRQCPECLRLLDWIGLCFADSCLGIWVQYSFIDPTVV